MKTKLLERFRKTMMAVTFAEAGCPPPWEATKEAKPRGEAETAPTTHQAAGIRFNDARAN